MNEFFAAEPECVSNASELRLLLNQFGPYAGRYLATYPASWLKDVEKVFDAWGDIEQARAMTALRRAKERASVLSIPALGWDQSRPWLDNAKSLVFDRPRRLDGVIVGAWHVVPDEASITSLENLQLPPTSDELIKATPEEFVRVCRTLLLISQELVLVDPYLDLCNQYVSSVFESLLNVIAKGKATQLRIWVRKSAVVSTDKGVTVTGIREALEGIMDSAPLRKGFIVKMHLVNDVACRDRMHARYLMSIKGGVRFDQGFQKLPKGRRVEVGPIGENTHHQLLSLYHEGMNDLKIENCISVRKA